MGPQLDERDGSDRRTRFWRAIGPCQRRTSTLGEPRGFVTLCSNTHTHIFNVHTQTFPIAPLHPHTGLATFSAPAQTYVFPQNFTFLYSSLYSLLFFLFFRFIVSFFCFLRTTSTQRMGNNFCFIYSVLAHITSVFFL